MDKHVVANIERRLDYAREVYDHAELAEEFEEDAPLRRAEVAALMVLAESFASAAGDLHRIAEALEGRDESAVTVEDIHR